MRTRRRFPKKRKKKMMMPRPRPKRAAPRRLSVQPPRLWTRMTTRRRLMPPRLLLVVMMRSRGAHCLPLSLVSWSRPCLVFPVSFNLILIA